MCLIFQSNILIIISLLLIFISNLYQLVAFLLLSIPFVLVGKVYFRSYTTFQRAENICMFTFIFIPHFKSPFVIVFICSFGSFQFVLTARTPMFSHTSVTLDGLTTIRAMRVASKFQDTFNRLQDRNMAASFMIKCSERWYGLSAEMTSSMLICIAAFMPIMLGKGE